MASAYVTVKIAIEVARDAKIVAACRQVTLADYLSETLRQCVALDLRKELVERSNEHVKLMTENGSSGGDEGRLVVAGEQNG